jgi:glutamate N-acetyltransferase / amino-acid N-acetyltransferase
VSVTDPKGFVAAGSAAGLKASGAPDLGLLIGAPGTTAAGLFTTNRAAAAPVAIGRERLAAGAVRGVLVNSGQANAGTGARGDVDARSITAAAADLVGLGPDELLPCSTGVIGEPLHVEAMTAALPHLAASLSEGGGGRFAEAILTTDTVAKVAAASGGGHVRVGGCAKGVGMIAPNLATMLAFVTTDAAVAAADLHRLAREQLQPRFESLTVDGCTSTNDSVLLFASGAAGEPPVEPGGAPWDQLAAGVAEVGEALLRQLAADAEGVTHVLIVDVEGAADDAQARRLAKAVADSPLVKTAAFGGDPNPGRILQAVGAAGADVDGDQVTVAVGGVEVVRDGVIPPGYFGGEPVADLARSAMKEPEIAIGVSVGTGAGRARAFGCDLGYGYVRINGEYTT